jgi:hypothetical protein
LKAEVTARRVFRAEAGGADDKQGRDGSTQAKSRHDRMAADVC